MALFFGFLNSMRHRRSSADVDLLTGHSTITPIISSMSNVTLLCVDVVKRPIASALLREEGVFF